MSVKIGWWKKNEEKEKRIARVENEARKKMGEKKESKSKTGTELKGLYENEVSTRCDGAGRRLAW